MNVQPAVRLARFLPIDLAVTVRPRPQVNQLALREEAEGWVRRFLDPYEGGLDGAGWPFAGTLYAADLGRMVTDLAGVRHVAEVEAFVRTSPDAPPGWESGRGHQSIALEAHDLFALVHVRVQMEEGLR